MIKNIVMGAMLLMILALNYRVTDMRRYTEDLLQRVYDLEVNQPPVDADIHVEPPKEIAT